MIVPVKSRRGMTLAELMVALGVVAVMLTMVVSFVVLMSGHTMSNQDNLNFQQDFAAVKAGVEDWMTAAAGQTLTAADTVAVPEGGTSGYRTVKAGAENTLQFQYNALRAGDRIIRTEYITAVTFQLEEENGEYLLFCSVKRAGSDERYTFCVNPRVGETAGGL